MINQTITFKQHLKDTAIQSERIVSYMIVGLFLFGVGISYHYETWLLGLGVGGALLGVYFISALFFRASLFSRMIGGSVMAFYMVQYLAQMHGLYEMHFWFFIMPMFLITYQDWKVYIPFALIIVIHHTFIFAMVMNGEQQYLQYFINMDQLTPMIFIYHMLLAVLGVLSAMWMSYRLYSQNTQRFLANLQLNEKLDEMNSVAVEIKQVASNIINTDHQEDASVSEALRSVSNGFSTIVEELVSEINEVTTAVQHDGDLSRRIHVVDKSGVWHQMSNSINGMLESIAKPILTIKNIVDEMADGKLSGQYVTEAQGDVRALAEALNTALSKMNQLLTQIHEGIDEVEEASGVMLASGGEMNSSTQEIASAIAQMSDGAARQVVSIENTSRIIEDILRKAQDIETKVQAINDTAETGVSQSEVGLIKINGIVESIEKIALWASQSLDSVNVLKQRSNEITKVLGVITEISGQTNLLALNAAIEAAQAGENGRGFAVVADEIRKLAEDSRKSSREIETLIADVQKDIASTVSLIQQMSQSVNSSVDSSKETVEVFNEISTGSRHTYKLSEEILTNTSEQTVKITEVVTNIESIVVIAEQTASGTEEVASSASELSSGMNDFATKSKSLVTISDQLKKSIGQFELTK